MKTLTKFESPIAFFLVMSPDGHVIAGSAIHKHEDFYSKAGNVLVWIKEPSRATRILGEMRLAQNMRDQSVINAYENGK